MTAQLHFSLSLSVYLTGDSCFLVLSGVCKTGLSAIL